MELKQKVTLKQKGEVAYIPVKDLVATLSWTAAVDLDLHAFYRAKDSVKPQKGFLGIGGVKPRQEGQVYYMSKGNLNKFPWISLDQDSGVGDVGGTNEENLRIAKLDELDHIIIVANIFNKPNANFASYDGRVTLRASGQEFEVPLTATTGGSWCVIAHIDNTDAMGAKLTNINKVQSGSPTVREYAK
jgi:tellurite resistance protein TerA